MAGFTYRSQHFVEVSMLVIVKDPCVHMSSLYRYFRAPLGYIDSKMTEGFLADSGPYRDGDPCAV